MRAARGRFGAASRAGLALLGVVVLAALVGPFAARGNGSIESMLAARDSGPSFAHPFGTSMEGYDVLSETLKATPLTLELILGATVLGLGLAVAVGATAGAFGGRADAFLSGLTGVFLALPTLPLAIVIAGSIPRGRHSPLATMLMIGLGSWAAEARVLRAQALGVRSKDFVSSALVIGESRLRIVVGEFVPVLASRIAAGAFFVAIQAMIGLTTLDFLASLSRGRFALGDTDGSTWGSLLATAQVQGSLLTGSWWVFAFPALALLVLAAGLVLTMIGLERRADRTALARVRRRFTLRAWHPQRPQLELRSPLPALGAVAAALPFVGRRVARRIPIYAAALLVAVTVSYALPRLAWRGSLQAPPPSGSFLGGYGAFLHALVLGHFGLGEPGAGATIRSTLPFSLALVGTASVLAFILGGLLGLIACWRRGGAFDGIATTGVAVVWTVPTFALAGVAIELFAVRWHVFPVQWAYALDLQPAWTWRFVASALQHAELPLLVLVGASIGLWALSVRAIAVGLIDEEYVQLARAKGLSGPRVMLRYVGRNAFLPALTGLAVAFSLAIGGVPALEEVFSYAGGGFTLQQAAMTGNLPLVQALVVLIALSVVVVNIVVDAAQVLLDPRLRTAQSP